MIAFIDDHRDDVRGRADLHGAADRPVDVLRAHGARRESETPPRARPSATAAARRDQAGVRRELQVYGVAQGLAAAARGKAHDVARCTVARLMREMGLRGVVRGQACEDDR